MDEWRFMFVDKSQEGESFSPSLIRVSNVVQCLALNAFITSRVEINELVTSKFQDKLQRTREKDRPERIQPTYVISCVLTLDMH